MSDFLMKPRIDFAFKEIMMDEQARIGFLSAMLRLNPGDIREARVLNTSLRKLHKDDKQGILDVRILLNDDTEIDIEIQLSALSVWADRSLFYLAKMYTEQIHSGQDYTVFKKCVGISILDFDLFKGESEFYSCFHLREDTRRTLYTDKLEFHVVELPKLPKELKEDSDEILLWAKFINAEKRRNLTCWRKEPPISKRHMRSCRCSAVTGKNVWKRENETAYKSSAIHPALLFVCRKKQPAEHVKLSLNSFYAPLCSSLYCFKARAS